MVVLYGLLVGIVVGRLRGGSAAVLRELTFAWPALAVCGLALQVLLFLPPVAEAVGDLGRPIYVGSTLAVVGFVLLNLRVSGVPLLAVGAISNLMAILANGGVMPVDPAAAAALGHEPGRAFSNAVASGDAVLKPLTDIIALPNWLPASNVISIGDVLITIGLAWAIQAAFRRPPASAQDERSGPGGGAARHLPPMAGDRVRPSH